MMKQNTATITKMMLYKQRIGYGLGVFCLQFDMAGDLIISIILLYRCDGIKSNEHFFHVHYYVELLMEELTCWLDSLLIKPILVGEKADHGFVWCDTLRISCYFSF